MQKSAPREGQRIIKAIWYQAKIDKGLRLEEVEDLAEQTMKMWDRTKEAYILPYSPDRHQLPNCPPALGPRMNYILSSRLIR